MKSLDGIKEDVLRMYEGSENCRYDVRNSGLLGGLMDLVYYTRPLL